jgi:hypothetical protein
VTAAAVLAATFLGAGAACAAPVVTAAARTVSASTQGAAPQALVSNTTGFFFEAASSQVFLDSGDGPRSEGSQTTLISSVDFSGGGESRSAGLFGRSALALSTFEVLFTLATDHTLDGQVRLSVQDRDTTSDVNFLFERLGAGGSLLFSADDDDGTGDERLVFGGMTLAAGSYRMLFSTQTIGSNLDNDASGSGLFQFGAFFTDLGVVGGPPATVPEPGSLALTLAGLLACGVLRPRKPAPQGL